MPSPILQPLTSRNWFPLAVAALVVLSLVPTKWCGWAGRFGELAFRLVAPISGPVTGLARRIAPDRRDAANAAEAEHYRSEMERFETLWLQTRQEIEELQVYVEELQRGLALSRDLPLQHVRRPVIGASSDLASTALRVRAGRRDGVDVNTVAVVQGVHLVGRVARVSDRTCDVIPITDRSSPAMAAKIMLGDGTEGLPCLLKPAGAGLLKGPVEYRSEAGVETTQTASPGQVVRLDDGAWPESARMLIVGRVVSVDPSPDQPQRRIVTVRPAMDLSRTSEVTLRILATEPPGGGQ